ncbi:unnamed protein product [Trichobilharzia regenti]|nr:unnamed protein product [Trichobilharzia regenti]
MDEFNSSSVLETTVKKLPVRLQKKFIKVSSRLEEDGLEPGLDDIVRLMTDSVNQTTGKFASILHSKVKPKEPVNIRKACVVKPQGTARKDEFIVRHNTHQLSDCNRLIARKVKNGKTEAAVFQLFKDGAYKVE